MGLNADDRSLSSARVPCTPIPRYPVVARWRADVDYVAAGIFCFQALTTSSSSSKSDLGFASLYNSHIA